MENGIIDLGLLNLEIFKCISQDITTARVIVTYKQFVHMTNKHQLTWNSELFRDVLHDPEFIFKDNKHENTGLVAKHINNTNSNALIILKINSCQTDKEIANSIISGWTISESRLKNYIRNKEILYKKL